MNFGEAIKFGFSNYANFEGRSRRSAYWWWFLFTTLVSAGEQIISQGDNNLIGSVVAGLVGLALLLPSLAFGVRRLHDTNRSGWNLLYILIPLAGAIILLVFFVEDSNQDTNRFGANPKGA